MKKTKTKNQQTSCHVYNYLLCIIMHYLVMFTIIYYALLCIILSCLQLFIIMQTLLSNLKLKAPLINMFIFVQIYILQQLNDDSLSLSYF